MEATVVLVLFLAVICGGMTLMLATGYRSSEQERARRASAELAKPVVGVKALPASPGFFASPDQFIRLGPVAFDDALVHRLEQHVRLEQAAVAHFVYHPSIDHLYRETGAPQRAH